MIAAVNRTIATQPYKLLGEISLMNGLVLTDGVSKNPGVVAATKELLRVEPLVPQDPQMIGAIGSATIAWDRYLKLKQRQQKP
jgi:activator of 2-hydroxyglutaryl-CoA dehydratase